MKLAIVHCRIAPGGALNVLKELIKEHTYTQARIFTMHSTIEYIPTNKGNIAITPIIPKRLHFIDHRLWMPLYPIIMKWISYKIKSYNPNHILISSFAIAKNIDQCKHPNNKTTLYLHSPMQYIRSHYEEYLQKIKGYKRRIFKIITPYLRKWDLKFTKYTKIYSNSQYTAHEAKKLYHITSTVQYPKIKSEFLNEPIEKQTSDYYVCVGRLVRFVREVDTIIKLFNQTKKTLLIIGSGPDELYLKSIAGDSIIFLGQIESNQELISIIKKARGLINLTKESFGIGTAEALCLGIPVFGYNDGATPELVDKNSGILTNNKSIHHLRKEFERFESTYRDKELIAEVARKKFQQKSHY